MNRGGRGGGNCSGFGSGRDGSFMPVEEDMIDYSDDDDMGSDLFDHAPILKKKAEKKRKASSVAARFLDTSKVVEQEADFEMEEASALSSDALQALISLQDFEGSWALSKALCRALGLDLAKVQAEVSKVKLDEKVFATALATRFFEMKLGKEKDTWELVVEKAHGWLEMQGHDEQSQVWKSADGLLA